jgi:hypothetical protein
MIRSMFIVEFSKGGASVAADLCGIMIQLCKVHLGRISALPDARELLCNRGGDYRTARIGERAHLDG